DVNPISGLCSASSAIRCCFVGTVKGFDAPAMFPSNGVMTWRPLLSTGSLGWFPRFNDTMGRSDSPPSVSTRSISSRADTTVSPVVCSPRSWASHRGPGSCRFRSPIRIYDGNVGVSQVPWKPWWSLSVLFDPGRIRQAEWTMSELPDTAPACVQDEGSKRLVFSGLNHTTFDLAVYASQDGSPHHHARLASGCWSGFARRDSYPQGFSERFQSSSLLLLPKAYLTQGHHTYLLTRDCGRVSFPHGSIGTCDSSWHALPCHPAGKPQTVVLSAKF